MAVWFRRVAWSVVALLALWLAAWLAVPVLIRWQVPLRLSEVLGRTVTLGEVGFKPWSLELTLNDLVIAGPAAANAASPTVGSEPLLRVRRVHADLAISSLLRRAPVIEALEIDAPQLHVARTAAGHYDIDDLIARFSPPTDAKPGEPARFALYNLQVRDASLRLEDRPVNRVHQVEALQLALPFLSNLPAQVDVKVQPHLAFTLNGTPFDSGAQATPFAQNRIGELKLTVNDLDLRPYLGYVPDTLPARVTEGRVSADLSLQFALPATGEPSLALKGTVGANDLKLNDAAGEPLLSWQHLQLGLTDLRPLARRLAFGALQIDGLRVQASRDAAGRINWLALAPSGSAAPAISPSASSVSTPVAPPPWRLSLASLKLVDARVRWNDAAVTPAAALHVEGLSIGAETLRWPVEGPVAVSIKGALRAEGAPVAADAEFTVDGPVSDREAHLELHVAALPLSAFGPYFAQMLVPRVEGSVEARLRLDWAAADEAPPWRLGITSATLDGLVLREGSARRGAELASLARLAIDDAQVDLRARSVALGSVKLVRPKLSITREADGGLNLQRWAVVAAARTSTADTRVGADPPTTPAWRLGLKDLSLEGGELSLTDAMPRTGAAPAAEPVRLVLSALRIGVQGLAWPADAGTPLAMLQFGARVAAPRRDGAAATVGLIDYRGRVGLQPVAATGAVRIERFPVHLLAPYVAEHAQLALLRAEAGYKGQIAIRQGPAGLDLSANGDVLLGDVHIATLPAGGAPAGIDNTDELLSWQALALKGLQLSLKPQGRPQIAIAEASLSDFYSRLVITDQGRFNLQDLGSAPAAPAGAASSVAAADTAGPALDVSLGPTTLRNGRVDFTDHFVRPNYSAALTELNGQLGAFSSTSRDMASLQLRGRAEGTALLEIEGRLNPSVKPLALDIHAKATDLELAPLSPYAGKYAGYAIERGKLSMDLAYRIDPDGKLDAKNRVVLNQLTFGEKIESKDATSLPVRLAVALLTDRNGVIDINLPVSGSINDPQFSVGGIILKVIVNLLTKALMAPFSLLSGNGGEDLSQVEFQPGTATLAAGGVSAIDQVARALSERPTLTMTVTGSADVGAERDAFLSAALESRLMAERRREALRAGVPADKVSAPDAASAPAAGVDPPSSLTGEERARILKQLYKNTQLPNKPRNLIGLAKDVPAPEMEALLKFRISVDDDALRGLALQRGLAVRDALIARGLPSERIFLAAPKLRAADAGEAAWTPHAQLALSAH